MRLQTAVLALLIGSSSLAPLSRAETPSNFEVCLQTPQSDCVLTIALALAAQIKRGSRNFHYGLVLAAMAQTGQADRALALGQAAGFLNELQLKGNVAEGLARGGELDAALALVETMESELFRQSVVQVIAVESIEAGQLAEARRLAGVLVALSVGTDYYSRRDRVEGLLKVAAEFAAAGYPQDARELARAAFPLAEDLLRESGSDLYPSLLVVKHLWLAGLKEEALHFAGQVPRPNWRQESWLWIGDSLMKAGQAEAALAAYHAALPPENTDAPGVLGWFSSIFKTEEPSVEADHAPLVGKVRALSALGRSEEAAALLPRFTSAIYRDKALVHLALGFADAGDPARALSLAEQIAGQKAHVELSTLAGAMADRGFAEEARGLFVQAIALGERQLAGLSAEAQAGLLPVFLNAEIVDVWIARALHEPLAEARGSFDAALATAEREESAFNRLGPRNAIATAMAEAGLTEAARTTFAATGAMIAGFSRTKQINALDQLILSQRAAGFDLEARASFARALQIAMDIEITLPNLGDGSLTDAIAFLQRTEGEFEVASFLVAASEALQEDGEPARARAALSRAMEHALTAGHLLSSADLLTDIAVRLHGLDHGVPRTLP